MSLSTGWKIRLTVSETEGGRGRGRGVRCVVTLA